MTKGKKKPVTRQTQYQKLNQKSLQKRLAQLDANQGQKAIVFEDVMQDFFAKRFKINTIHELEKVFEMQRRVRGYDKQSQAAQTAPFVVNIDRSRQSE
ncbi:MAG: hypothetical protein HQL06_00940 [Nitrospirae bacterium]|nr:hypothetical protein [Nitrospirota bacterium]